MIDYIFLFELRWYGRSS